MTIYIDNEYKCHASPGEGLRAVETDYFDDKCSTFIEGYRYVPEGETWTREDGAQFTGEMVAPWKPYQELAAAQLGYEGAMEEADGYIAALVDEIYNMELEGIYNV